MWGFKYSLKPYSDDFLMELIRSSSLHKPNRGF